MIARNENRNAEVMTRAQKDRADTRKAKRFYNRMIAETRRANGKHGNMTQRNRNGAKRVMLRVLKRG